MAFNKLHAGLGAVTAVIFHGTGSPGDTAQQRICMSARTRDVWTSTNLYFIFDWLCCEDMSSNEISTNEFPFPHHKGSAAQACSLPALLSFRWKIPPGSLLHSEASFHRSSLQQMLKIWPKNSYKSYWRAHLKKHHRRSACISVRSHFLCTHWDTDLQVSTVQQCNYVLAYASRDKQLIPEFPLRTEGNIT